MRIIQDYAAELKILEGYIKRQAAPGSVLQILEAGCGREWYFDLETIPHVITGVDLDEEALRRRSQGKRDLTREIVGDLRTVELPSASFDVIYSSFVLEHVSGADRVLENFVRWLRPGGLLIVRVPDISSVQAFLARCLPYWCSVLYHRYAWGSKDAGKPGFAPYPIVYDDVISQPGLREFCARYGLLIQDEIGVGSYAARGSGIIRIATPILARLVRWLTLGRVHDHHVDLTLVAKKLAVGSEPAPT